MRINNKTASEECILAGSCINDEFLDLEKFYSVNFAKWSLGNNRGNIGVEGSDFAFCTSSSLNIRGLRVLKSKVGELIRVLLGSLLTAPDLVAPTSHCSPSRTIFFTRSFHRADQDADFSGYLRGVPCQTRIIICTLLANRKRKLRLKFFVRSLIAYSKQRKTFEAFFISHGLNSLFDRLLATSWFLHSFTDLLALQRFISESDMIVSFQEMVGAENIILQYANSVHVPTVAVQHAIGFIPHYFTPLTKSYHKNLIHYLPSVARKICVWGEYSRRQYQKYTDAMIFVTGKPFVDAFEIVDDGYTVILEYNENINRRLLNLAERLIHLGYPCSIWRKPNDNDFTRARAGPLRRRIIGYESGFLAVLGSIGCAVYALLGSVFLSLEGACSLHCEPDWSLADLGVFRVAQLERNPRDFIDAYNDEAVNRFRDFLECHLGKSDLCVSVSMRV